MLSAINARYCRAPWTVDWNNGLLADAGLMIHFTKGWAFSSSEQFLPDSLQEVSASLIWRDRPFLLGSGNGLLFKPGVAKILCGKATDVGSSCQIQQCSRGVIKDCKWPPSQMGYYTRKATQAGGEFLWLHSEVMLDPQYLPEMVEAVIGDPTLHTNFLRRYNLSEDTHPLIRFNPWGDPSKPFW